MNSIIRSEVLAKLRQAQPQLRMAGVKRLRLFGSFARDEASSTSDVDVLVEFDSRPIGLFEMARIQRMLEELLGVDHVDLVTPEGLHPALRNRILAEVLDAA